MFGLNESQARRSKRMDPGSGRHDMIRTASLLAAACFALAASTIARAQLVVSEKEVRREALTLYEQT